MLSGGAIFAQGLLGFSKEGMFTPLVCWLVAAASQRYKLSLLYIAGGIAAVVFMFHFLVPYSQYGRNFVGSDQPLQQRISTATSLLSNLGEVRQEFNESNDEAYSDNRGYGYFNTSQGFLDRLQMISVDDRLIEVTERKGTFGYAPIIFGFENLVPHVFWPSKPAIIFGNVYAHEIGGLPEDDNTTGVSFSPSGGAYHMGRWEGVFLVAPLLWIMFFTIFDSLCGDTRISPWGLLIASYFSHLAPEGMPESLIWSMVYTTLALLVAAFSAAYVMPIIGTLVKGPENTLILPASRRSHSA